MHQRGFHCQRVRGVQFSPTTNAEKKLSVSVARKLDAGLNPNKKIGNDEQIGSRTRAHEGVVGFGPAGLPHQPQFHDSERTGKQGCLEWGRQHSTHDAGGEKALSQTSRSRTNTAFEETTQQEGKVNEDMEGGIGTRKSTKHESRHSFHSNYHSNQE